MGKIFILVLVIAMVSVFGLFELRKTNFINQNKTAVTNQKKTSNLHPLSVEYMRGQVFPGSDIVIEETLPPGSNYNRYIASYRSEGLKIFALLTVPFGTKPENGWPVIIFNHGYIPPEEYVTTEKYIAYTDAFSRNGYIVFRSDYRGHGNSEGKPEGAYYSPGYTVDILNAVASMKKYKEADPKRIGMWGHSMGGMITLRSMVVSKDIQAGEIWAGVAVSYEDMATRWRNTMHNPRPFVPSQREQGARRPGRQSFIDAYGDFKTNPEFWQSISPISYVKDISGPLQLQHGTADSEVPLLFSQILNEAMKKAEKQVELYVYEGDDHNLSNNLSIALERSVAFFDSHLKKR